VCRASHTMMKHRHEGVIGGKRERFCVSVGRLEPVIRCPSLSDAVLRTHGCCGVCQAYRIKIVMAKLSRSACIDKGPVGGPQAHDDAHRCATGWAADDERLRGYDPHRLAIDGVCLRDQQAEGGGRDATAGMEKAEMTDFHEAIGQDVLEEPAEKLHDVEMGGAWACTAHFTVGEGDRAVREADETAVGDGDLEDIRGQVGEGRVAMWRGLTMDIPRDGPHLGVDVLQQSGLAHVVFEDGSVDGGQGFDGDKEVGSGGAPGCAVF